MPRTEKPPAKACCLISEVLEEAGLDREKVLALRRQLLQGVVMFCQWQLERMDEAQAAAATSGGARKQGARQARKVAVE
jgi:hypothetical protein